MSINPLNLAISFFFEPAHLFRIPFVVTANIPISTHLEAYIGDSKNKPVTTLVDFLIQPPPAKDIPKVVEAFNFFLARINMTKARDRLDLGKARVKLKDWAKGSEEV